MLNQSNKTNKKRLFSDPKFYRNSLNIRILKWKSL